MVTSLQLNLNDSLDTDKNHLPHGNMPCIYTPKTITLQPKISPPIKKGIRTWKWSWPLQVPTVLFWENVTIALALLPRCDVWGSGPITGSFVIGRLKQTRARQQLQHTRHLDKTETCEQQNPENGDTHRSPQTMKPHNWLGITSENKIRWVQIFSNGLPRSNRDVKIAAANNVWLPKDKLGWNWSK